MQASPIFTETLREMRYGTRTIVHQGGQNSGKTVNILMALAVLAHEDNGTGTPDVPKVTTITSHSFPHLHGGALRDFETYVYPEFKDCIAQYHMSKHLFIFKSGHTIEFKTFETEVDARGPKRKYLFVNEANSFDYMRFFQLQSRAQQTIIDYNPSARFWAHEKLIPAVGTKLLISDHRHNPFLKDWQHKMIEAYTGDLFKVYARGLTGNVKGIIFPNWTQIQREDFDDDNDCQYGLDFGFTVDPTAIVKGYRIGRNLFIRELFYEVDQSATTIAQILKVNGYVDTAPAYCEHVPEMGRQLRDLGITAIPARKGQGSINAGITMINRDYNVFFCGSNIAKERETYIWTVNKQTGDTENVPVDRHNHLMDAIRYLVFSHFFRDKDKA